MMCSVATEPLKSIDELWEWKETSVDGNLVGQPLQHYIGRRAVAETLVCHDMKGGYLPEERTEDCLLDESSSPYALMHWWYIDVFVYFSHTFITIPPVGWINQAHHHGVIILGTFIIECFDGISPMCDRILSGDEAVEKTVQKMVAIAVAYNFEGWLINIESRVQEENLEMLEKFLSMLTKRMRNVVGDRSRVIWYDSVTVKGELKWQNQLNDNNERWFNATDGIFLNYTWNKKQLEDSARRAGDARHHSVYVGVDCFGRGCYGGGGWNCHEAVALARNYDLSIALFAPGWVAEKFPHSALFINSLRFWDRLASLVYAHPIISLPICTNFSIGFVYQGDKKYYNLCSAQMQPFYLDSGVWPRTCETSLVLSAPGNYRLFQCDLILSGEFNVEVTVDVPVGLLFWTEEGSGDRNLPETTGKATHPGQWSLQLTAKHVRGIGLSCEQVAILKSFSMKRAELNSSSDPLK